MERDHSEQVLHAEKLKLELDALRAKYKRYRSETTSQQRVAARQKESFKERIKALRGQVASKEALLGEALANAAMYQQAIDQKDCEADQLRMHHAAELEQLRQQQGWSASPGEQVSNLQKALDAAKAFAAVLHSTINTQSAQLVNKDATILALQAQLRAARASGAGSGGGCPQAGGARHPGQDVPPSTQPGAKRARPAADGGDDTASKRHQQQQEEEPEEDEPYEYEEGWTEEDDEELQQRYHAEERRKHEQRAAEERWRQQQEQARQRDEDCRERRHRQEQAERAQQRAREEERQQQEHRREQEQQQQQQQQHRQAADDGFNPAAELPNLKACSVQQLKAFVLAAGRTAADFAGVEKCQLLSLAFQCVNAWEIQRILKAATRVVGPIALHNAILRNPTSKGAARSAALALHTKVHPDKNPTELCDKANAAAKLLNAAKEWAEAHLA